jgi:pyruvate/2-oxoglutarate dehydrogenase complex dihydrolipoamide dehydrogenase (E3) component
VRKTEQGISLTCVDMKTGVDQQVHGETLFIAAGRAPNIQHLGLDALDMRMDKAGIHVDTTLRTSLPNIYACGDVIGHYQFSHMAWYEAVIAARNACIPFFKKRVDYSGVIWVTFTAPELATVGLTEKQARAQYGDSIQVFEFSYDHLDRARTDCEREGKLKVVCDKKGCIIGAHLLGAGAGEVIHELQIARAQGMRLRDIQPIIHAYPTYAESVWHISKKAYLHWLENMPLIRFAKKLIGKK